MIILLHGFWGEPRDYNPVIEALPLGAPVWVPDLFAPGPLSPVHDFEKWTDNFVNEVRSRFNGQVTLVGYSMGGRLALHALARASSLFKRSLIISAAPYFTETFTGEREGWERRWAERFRHDDWPTLNKDWQKQAVFAHSTTPPPKRRENAELREPLARALLTWSARMHRFGPATIKAFPKTVDWAFGALDQKYSACAKLLQELPVRGQIELVPESGHRVVKDAPAAIAKWINAGGG